MKHHQKTWIDYFRGQAGVPVLMVNSLAEPNPVEHFYRNDWVDEGFALYHSTPMHAMIGQSPWLIRPKQGALNALARALDKGTLTDWGWAYYTDWPWHEQLNHWRSRLLVNSGKQQIVLRLMDSRVLSAIATGFGHDEWGELMTPVCEFVLPTLPITHYQRPEKAAKRAQQPVYTLSPSILGAWDKSPQALEQQLFRLESEIWEDHGEQAMQFPDQGANLTAELRQLLVELQKQGTVLHTLTAQQALTMMDNKNNKDRLNDYSEH